MYTQCVLSLNRPNDVRLHCEHEFRIISEFAIICRSATAEWERLRPADKQKTKRAGEKSAFASALAVHRSLSGALLRNAAADTA